ncbi:MAG: PPOX class F420-dependent oxidoreductase [Frankiales bacterium]|nr:PPOX class F420-dependent oxidoreductase [Frankiales bacterium]
MDLDEARDYLRKQHHAVLATMRRDGTPQMSPVTVSVDADGYVVVSSRDTAMKVKNLRRDPRAWVCAFPDAFYGGPFVQVEGNVTIVDLPEAMDGLVDYYRSVSGEHPDWDDYRAAMVRDQRVLIKLDITRAGPDVQG